MYEVLGRHKKLNFFVLYLTLINDNARKLD